MKNEEVLSIANSISKEELKELLKETKETIASVNKETVNRSFSVIDFWNVQRKQRTSSDMRRWLN